MYELLLPLKNNEWMLALSILGAIGAALEIFGESRDFGSYALFFDDLRWSPENAAESSRFELGFVWLSYFLIQIMSSDYAVVGVLVFLALWVKLFAFSYRGVFAAWGPAAAVIVYYAVRILPLHEFTQIRAALAISFVYASFVFVERRRYLEAIVSALFAVSFHLSAAFVLPLIILRPTARFGSLALALVIFAFVAGFGGWLLDNLSLDVRTLQLYQETGHGGRGNPLSVLVLLDLCLVVFGFVFWDRATSAMKTVLSIELIGMTVFYGLLDYTIVGFRIYEIFATMWVFYLFDAIRCDRIHTIAVGVYLMLSIMLYPILYIFYDPLFL